MSDSARLAAGAQVWRAPPRPPPADVLEWRRWAGPPVLGGTEQGLLDVVARLLRAGTGRTAFALHLSALRPPGPRAHHRRAARAILEAVARRREGEVFALRGGDLVLLCRPGEAGAADDPAALRGTFARLLQFECDEPARLATLWALPAQAPSVLAYIRAQALRREEPRQPEAPPLAAGPEGPPRPAVQPALRLGPAGSTEVLHRRIAMTLPSGGPSAGAVDPWLRRHALRAGDTALLGTVAARAGRGGPLDILDQTQPAAVLALGLPAATGEAFAALAARGAAAGRPAHAEVALVEAVADPAGFAALTARLHAAGALLMLGEVPLLALCGAQPAALAPDLMVLEWSPRVAGLPEAEAARLNAAVAAAGPERLVLAGDGSAGAFAWAAAHGLAGLRSPLAPWPLVP